MQLSFVVLLVEYDHRICLTYREISGRMGETKGAPVKYSRLRRPRPVKPPGVKETFEEMIDRHHAERAELVLRALKAYDWNVSYAARYLGTYPQRVRSVIFDTPELKKLWEANKQPQGKPRTKLPKGVV